MTTINGDKIRSGIREVVPQEGDPGSVPATKHATTWESGMTRHFQRYQRPEELELISHANCSYLSGHEPPTLLELKKHAQSLTIVIRKLTVNTKFGIPDAEAKDKSGRSHWRSYKFRDNEAFDWMNDLSKPYENDDAYHHFPLRGVHNEVRSEDDVHGITYHCPLPSAKRDVGSYVALLHHANEALEILDHEYSATGGILSLLPSHEGEDSSEMKGARNTLLGQWLLFQHHLIGRLHELEIEYSNACSALSWEAEIPKQIINKQTFEQRLQGHEVAHLQDKFILVNAGEASHKEIHRLLDEEERKMEERARQWADAGVMGERMFHNANDEGTEFLSEGLVKVDLTSRFYRVKGDGPQAAIFVLPAMEDQDSLMKTREMETNPGVVTVPMSKWPARVSDWERKYREKIHKADVNTELQPAVEMLKKENKKLKEEVRVLRMKEAGNYPRWGAGAGF